MVKVIMGHNDMVNYAQLDLVNIYMPFKFYVSSSMGTNVFGSLF